MNRLVLISAFVITACSGITKSTPSGPTPAKVDTEFIMGLERAYWAAEERRDWKALDSLLAPDYVYISSRGGQDRSKAEELALLSGGRVHLLSYKFSSPRSFHISDDVVILQYVVNQLFTLDQKTYCPHSGSMTVWARRGDRWLRTARTEYVIGTLPEECPAAPPK